MLKLPIEPGEDAGAIAEFCGKYIVCPAKVGKGIDCTLLRLKSIRINEEILSLKQDYQDTAYKALL